MFCTSNLSFLPNYHWLPICVSYLSSFLSIHHISLCQKETKMLATLKYLVIVYFWLCFVSSINLTFFSYIYSKSMTCKNLNSRNYIDNGIYELYTICLIPNKLHWLLSVINYHNHKSQTCQAQQSRKNFDNYHMPQLRWF